MTSRAHEDFHTTARSLGLLLLRIGAFAMILTFHVRPKIEHFDSELLGFPDPLGVGHLTSLLLALLADALLLLGPGPYSLDARLAPRYESFLARWCSRSTAMAAGKTS